MYDQYQDNDIPSLHELQQDAIKKEFPKQCQTCELLEAYSNDNTIGHDLEPRLRGPEDIELIPACEEFPDRVKPDECSRRIVTNRACDIISALKEVQEANALLLLPDNPFIQPKINLNIAEKKLKNLLKSA